MKAAWILMGVAIVASAIPFPAAAQVQPPAHSTRPRPTVPPGPANPTGGAYIVTNCQIQNTPDGYLLVKIEERRCTGAGGSLNSLYTSQSYFDATVGFQMLICPSNPIPPGWRQVANSNTRQCSSLYGTSIWIEKFQ